MASISDYYDTSYGYSILKVDLATNQVQRIIGVDTESPNHGNETDGPAITSAAFRGGARGIYHPGYKAIFIDGADSLRYRWWKLGGDGWVRTIFGTLRPETEVKPFGITEANSLGMEGEQFRLGVSSITRFMGVGANAGVYVGGVWEMSGIWRAYDKTVGNPLIQPSNPSVENGEGSRINAALIGPNGQLLNAPIEISPSSKGVQAHPRVAYHNGTFLVVWHDLRNGSDFDILGVRISSDGTVLDSSPLRIGIGPRTQSMPDVAAQLSASQTSAKTVRSSTLTAPLPVKSPYSPVSHGDKYLLDSCKPGRINHVRALVGVAVPRDRNAGRIEAGGGHRVD